MKLIASSLKICKIGPMLVVIIYRSLDIQTWRFIPRVFTQDLLYIRHLLQHVHHILHLIHSLLLFSYISNFHRQGTRLLYYECSLNIYQTLRHQYSMARLKGKCLLDWHSRLWHFFIKSLLQSCCFYHYDNGFVFSEDFDFTLL